MESLFEKGPVCVVEPGPKVPMSAIANAPPIEDCLVLRRTFVRREVPIWKGAWLFAGGLGFYEIDAKSDPWPFSGKTAKVIGIEVPLELGPTVDHWLTYCRTRHRVFMRQDIPAFLNRLEKMLLRKSSPAAHGHMRRFVHTLGERLLEVTIFLPDIGDPYAVW